MKDTVIIPTSMCKEGMITAEPIFNEFGGIMIGQEIELDKSLLEKINSMEVFGIKVYRDSAQRAERTLEQIKKQKEKHFEEVKEKYDDNVNILKNVIKDINLGKTLDIEKIGNVVGSLTETFKEDDDVIRCFKIFKDVDEHLYNHGIDVSLLSALIGKWIGLKEEEINDLAYAGLLHDIGKAKISFKILHKNDKLTPEEEEKLKQHVEIGYKMLETIPKINQNIKLGVLMHHERMDGNGYMLGASGDQIHIYGRIVAVANKFDYYTKILRRNPFKVFDSIRYDTFGDLDPKIVMNFLKNVSEYYIGDMFRLSTGELGEVISINYNDISRPLIRIDNAFVNLAEEKSIQFEEII